MIETKNEVSSKLNRVEGASIEVLRDAICYLGNKNPDLKSMVEENLATPQVEGSKDLATAWNRLKSKLRIDQKYELHSSALEFSVLNPSWSENFKQVIGIIFEDLHYEINAELRKITPSLSTLNLGDALSGSFKYTDPDLSLKRSFRKET